MFKVQFRCSMSLSFISFYWWIMSHCIDTSHFIYIHSSVVGYWVVSTFWLLWTMLLQILVYRFLCGHILLYGNSMFNLLRSCLTGFPKRLQHFTFHLPCMRVLVSPHPLQPLWIHLCDSSHPSVWNGILLWFWLSFLWWMCLLYVTFG